ncbi:LLM class F420-dependent oxidoreductase [Mycolicibacterium sp. Dal123E01]|uniref:LLM class F420-dependent oxidoreductase n=1 Tax=Mycolicibacterium sp. Dal123E01 TaxID=3457578 RepID=UPI00403E7215
MRIGLSTPMVMQLPGVSSEWERNAEVADLARIAHVADELGFDHLTCAEHVAIPVENHERGLTYWDPLSTLGFLAAHTSRISLTTSIVVLGYHHPLEIAKRFGTLDLLSGGRLVLGVGVGSLKEEFDLLGATFDGRGERADDAIRALRASMSTTRPSYQGTHYQFDGFAVEPCAVQPRVPIWVGGHTLRSLRRAVQLADGWIPFGLNTTEIAAMLSGIDAQENFEVVLSTGRAIDPLADSERITKRLIALRDAGATAVTCSVTAESPDHYCDQLAALKALADEL